MTTVYQFKTLINLKSNFRGNKQQHQKNKNVNKYCCILTLTYIQIQSISIVSCITNVLHEINPSNVLPSQCSSFWLLLMLENLLYHYLLMNSMTLFCIHFFTIFSLFQYMYCRTITFGIIHTST